MQVITLVLHTGTVLVGFFGFVVMGMGSRDGLSDAIDNRKG